VASSVPPPIDESEASSSRERAHSTKPRRRVLKWGLISLSVLVVIALGLAGGVWYYVNEQIGNIKTFKTVHGLRVDPPPNAPMDILLIGSDSRSFVKSKAQSQAFGNPAVQTGQRSDVIIIARLIPATDKVVLLSIPRDTWVPIYGTGGSQRINTAYNNGPSRLVETITHDFGIPIDHVIQANFPGLTNVVNALGGVYLNFPDQVLDVETGLHIKTTGCQLLNGTQALQLVRSRHLEYRRPGQSTWSYDGMSDWSRIRRQQAFFHAVLNRAHQNLTNIFSMLRFIHAVTADLVVDKGLTTHLIESLGWHYRHAGNSDLKTMVLPTYGTWVAGSAVVMPAEPYASKVVKQFLSYGAAPGKKKAGGVTTTTTSGVPTTTTPANQIVFDTPKTLPEPWNPVPCNP
jgi:LCP family protein required for cell wall assembly